MSLLTTMMTPQQAKKPSWETGLGLWNMAAFKITGLAMVEFFMIQAFDEDLKDMLETAKEKIIIPHIERIQEFMENEKITAPAVPNRKNLQAIQNKLEPNSIFSDNEIAIDICTIIRQGLQIDLAAITDIARPDVRKFAWDIFSDDFKDFDSAAKLFVKKNWIETPPTI